MTKIVLSGIRLAAALIILTAALGSAGEAHGSRMGAPVNGCSRELVGVVCLDRDDEDFASRSLFHIGRRTAPFTAHQNPSYVR